jgi:hypothetical protein
MYMSCNYTIKQVYVVFGQAPTQAALLRLEAVQERMRSREWVRQLMCWISVVVLLDLVSVCQSPREEQRVHIPARHVEESVPEHSLAQQPQGQYRELERRLAESHRQLARYQQRQQ